MAGEQVNQRRHMQCNSLSVGAVATSRGAAPFLGENDKIVITTQQHEILRCRKLHKVVKPRRPNVPLVTVADDLGFANPLLFKIDDNIAKKIATGADDDPIQDSDDDVT